MAGDGATINAQLARLANRGDWLELHALLCSLNREALLGGPPVLVSYWRGRLALAHDTPQTARRWLASAVAQSPDYAQAWIYLAVAHRLAGEWSSAAESLRCVLRLHPNNLQARVELSRACLATGDAALAVALLASVRSQLSDVLSWSIYAQAIVQAEPDLELAALTTEASLPPHQLLLEPLCRQWMLVAGGLHLTGDLSSAQLWWLRLSRLPPNQSNGAFPRRPALMALLLLNLQQRSRSTIECEDWMAQLLSLQTHPPSPPEWEAWTRWLKDLLVEVLAVTATGTAGVPAELRSALTLFDTGWVDLALQPLRACEFRLQRAITLAPYARWSMRHGLLGDLMHCAAQTSRRSLLLLTHPSPDLLERALALTTSNLALTSQAICALASLWPSRPTHQRPRRRWLFLASRQIPQCFLYRVEQKCQQLSDLGCDSRVVLQDQLSDPLWTWQLLWADAVMVCRLPGVVPVLKAIEQAKTAGLPVFYDVDDLVFDAQFCPPALSSYAGTLLPELHRRFVLDVPLVAAAKQACDAVIVSTNTLAERSRALTPKQSAFVFPNLALPELCAALREPSLRLKRQPVRLVLATGSGAHKQVWREELAPALAELLARYSRIELTLLGPWQLPLVLLPHQDRIRSYPVADYATYIERLSQADIGLVPLEPGTFTDAKSAIRWMELSYLGLPSVLSPSRTYTEILEDGVHACFARDHQAWIDQVEWLLDDPNRRHDMALRAQHHAQRLFQPDVAQTSWAPLIGIDPSPVKRRGLLVISSAFAPFAWEPMARIAEQHVLELQRSNRGQCDITVLCCDDQPTHGSSQVPSVVVHDWQGVRVVRVSAYPSAQDLDQLYRGWLTDDRFDLIHVHDLRQLTVLPLQIAQEQGIPYVISLHDMWWLSSRDRWPLLQSAAVRLSHSRGLSDVLRREGCCAWTDIALPWTPLMFLGDDRARPDDQPLRCCCFTSTAAEVFTLLRAAVLNACPDAPGLVLTLIDLEQPSGAVQEQQWGHVSVQIHPADAMAEPHHGFANQDVLLMPSIAPIGFRLEVVEALSAGLWVVASDRGGLADPILDGVNGEKVAANDVSRWTEVLERLSAVHPLPQPLVQFRQDTEGHRRDWTELYRPWLG